MKIEHRLKTIDSCAHVHLTNVNKKWNPSTIKFQNGNNKELSQCSQNHTLYSALLSTIYNSTFCNYKILKLNSSLTYYSKYSFISLKGYGSATPKKINYKLLLGPKQARLTLLNTNQNCIRFTLMPLSRRYRGELFLSKEEACW